LTHKKLTYHNQNSF